jgi:hypothetical protein
MRPLTAWRLLAALLACTCTAALAEPIGYVSGFHTLYRVDLATGQSTRVGADAGIAFIDVEALAFDGAGTLHGVADGGRFFGGNTSSTTDFLFRVGVASGVGSLVAQMPGLQGQGPNGNLDYGMGFGCDGRLWLSSATTGQFWQLDPTTAGVTLIGNLGVPISGLAARGGILYGVSIDPQPGLYRINVADAVATLIGPLGIGGSVKGVGLSFDGAGQLWATLDGADLNPTRVVRINTSTGAATQVSSLSLQNGAPARALAIAAGACMASEPAAVPGPGLPVLILLALVCAGIGARRVVRP